MIDKAVKGTRKITSTNTMANAMSFLIQQIIRENVNTAEVVIVESVDAGGPGAATGHVDVKPLVCQTDAYNNTLKPATLFRLPYSRIQGGIAALVIDPVPGDIGIALFAKRDSSGVKQGATDPVQPASFRTFDQADGFYIGGFLNRGPEAWLCIDPTSGEIELRTKIANARIISDTGDIRVTATVGNITVEAPAGDITVNAPAGTIEATAANAVVNSSMTIFNGAVTITGGLAVGGIARGIGGKPLKMQGGLENEGGTVRSNNITLDSHVHSGVSTGPNNTGGPTG